jgi:hypothetical protein
MAVITADNLIRGRLGNERSACAYISMPCFRFYHGRCRGHSGCTHRKMYLSNGRQTKADHPRRRHSIGPPSPPTPKVTAKSRSGASRAGASSSSTASTLSPSNISSSKSAAKAAKRALTSSSSPPPSATKKTKFKQMRSDPSSSTHSTLWSGWVHLHTHASSCIT